MDGDQKNYGRGRVHPECEGQHQGYTEIGAQGRQDAHNQTNHRSQQQPEYILAGVAFA